MNEPVRLRDGDTLGLETLAAAVRRAGEPEPVAAGAVVTLMDAATARASRRLVWRDARWFVGSASAAALITWLVVRVVLATPALTVEPGAVMAEGRLSSGRVHGAPSRTVARLSTPHASLAWTRARFLLEVDARRSLLSVEEGEVVWRSDGEERRVHGGETVRAPAPLEVPFAPPAAPRSTECVASPLAARLECLERLATGDGLKAQNALVEWSLLQEPERAVDGWRRYLARFPDGALAPEASLSLLGTLVRLERYDEALEAARAHRERFPQLFPTEVGAIEAKLQARTKGQAR